MRRLGIVPVARSQEDHAAVKTHHFLLHDGNLHPAGLLPVVRQARGGAPALLVRQDQGQGVIQVGVRGAVGIRHPPGAVGPLAPAPGQEAVAVSPEAGEIPISPGINPGKGGLIPGPHGPKQGVGLGLGNGAALLLRQADPAVRLDEVAAVTLPGGGEHLLQPGLGRFGLAGETESAEHDNENKVIFFQLAGLNLLEKGIKIVLSYPVTQKI